jgi:hypothetical protein
MNFYLILYHEQNKHLNNLISILGSNVYVHPCKSIKSINPKIINNARVVSKRFYGNWGGFGIVEATIEGIRQILKENSNVTHITLLSGSDYPIKPINDYNKFLNSNINKSFLRYWKYFPFEMTDYNKIEIHGQQSFDFQKLRITKYYFDAFGTRYSVPPNDSEGYFEFDRKLLKLKHYIKFKFKGFTNSYVKELFQLTKSLQLNYPRIIPLRTIYGASQWWTLTKDHCEYIVNFHDNNPIIHNFFRHIMLPDETYIQSILLNSNYSKEVINNNLRYIIFPEEISHPKILTDVDFEDINNSNAFFARKFDEIKSGSLIKRINI